MQNPFSQSVGRIFCLSKWPRLPGGGSPALVEARSLGCEIRRRLSGRDALGYGSCPALVGGVMRWAMRFSGVRQGAVGVTLRVFRWKCGGIGAADSPALVGARRTWAVGIPWRSPKCGCTGAVMVPAGGWRSWPLDGGVCRSCNFRKIKAAGGKAAVRGRGGNGEFIRFQSSGRRGALPSLRRVRPS